MTDFAKMELPFTAPEQKNAGKSRNHVNSCKLPILSTKKQHAKHLVEVVAKFQTSQRRWEHCPRQFLYEGMTKPTGGFVRIASILNYMGVSKNRGETPKMDGENNGKPMKTLLKFMIWVVFPYFWFNTHPHLLLFIFFPFPLLESQA